MIWIVRSREQADSRGETEGEYGSGCVLNT
jgi:hypothetical protein